MSDPEPTDYGDQDNPNVIEFQVPGVAVPKGRPRFSAWIVDIFIKGRRKQIVKTNVRTPAATRKYMDVVWYYARQAVPRDHVLWTCPLDVEIIIYKPFLASFSNKIRGQAARAEFLPVTKPDVDNYAKSILDAMEGVIYKNDSQVTDLTIRKRYYHTPAALIRVERIGGVLT